MRRFACYLILSLIFIAMVNAQSDCPRITMIGPWIAIGHQATFDFTHRRVVHEAHTQPALLPRPMWHTSVRLQVFIESFIERCVLVAVLKIKKNNLLNRSFRNITSIANRQ